MFILQFSFGLPTHDLTANASEVNFNLWSPVLSCVMLSSWRRCKILIICNWSLIQNCSIQKQLCLKTSRHETVYFYNEYKRWRKLHKDGPGSWLVPAGVPFFVRIITGRVRAGPVVRSATDICFMWRASRSLDLPKEASSLGFSSLEESQKTEEENSLPTLIWSAVCNFFCLNTNVSRYKITSWCTVDKNILLESGNLLNSEV